MKKLFLLLIILGFGASAYAQCVSSFTVTVANSNNNLLRRQFSNTSTYGTLTNSQYLIGTINYGDAPAYYPSYPGNSTYHNYTAPGTYLIKQRIMKMDSVTNTILCDDSTSQSITVAYTACGTSISMSGSPYNYTFTATTPGATGTMTYTWDFGDGTTGTGSPITHFFTIPGAHTVTLVSTGGGCTYSSTGPTVTVATPPSCSNLHALLTTSVNGSTVSVSNNSTYATGYTKVSTLDYGDGSAVTSATSHSYAASGTYTIKLRVKWIDSATQALFCQDSITHQVTIAPPLSSIRGAVIVDSAVYAGQNTFKVWLIQYNSTTLMLDAVDSLQLTGYASAYYMFNNKPAGSYLVKAAMLNQTVGAAGVIPTYHDSSLYWNLAQTIVYSGTGITYANIWMKNGTVTSGPGFVAGNVSLGANKGAQNGVQGLQVYLRNNAGVAIKSALTDANGNFSFSSVPVGIYSVYPENMNYATTAATSVIVTNGTPNATGINFNQDNTQRNIKPRGLGVDVFTGSNTSLFTIAPNPAGKAVTVSWTGVDAKGAHLIISNITGQTVINKSVSNAGAETIDVSSLQPGAYFLRGTEALSGTTQKLMIK